MKRDDGLSLRVQFTQEITIHPPSSVEDRFDAECWFRADPAHILRDVINVNQGDIEVLAINGGEN